MTIYVIFSFFLPLHLYVRAPQIYYIWWNSCFEKLSRHAWNNYKQFAWGHDHLLPLSKSSEEWFHLGLTIVDSLDTMLIMNLQTEFKEAKDWVESSLDFNGNTNVNLFETTIRLFILILLFLCYLHIYYIGRKRSSFHFFQSCLLTVSRKR